jgi:hypothetical protein
LVREFICPFFSSSTCLFLLLGEAIATTGVGSNVLLILSPVSLFLLVYSFLLVIDLGLEGKEGAGFFKVGVVHLSLKLVSVTFIRDGLSFVPGSKRD